MSPRWPRVVRSLRRRVEDGAKRFAPANIMRATARRGALRAMQPFTAYQEEINAAVTRSLDVLGRESDRTRTRVARSDAAMLAKLRQHEPLLMLPRVVEAHSRVIDEIKVAAFASHYQTDRSIYLAVAELALLPLGLVLVLVAAHGVLGRHRERLEEAHVLDHPQELGGVRPEEDRRAVVEGLRDGTIDAIASDHCPQDQDSKRLPFAQAAFGVIGLETMLPVALSLHHEGRIGLLQLLRTMEGVRPGGETSLAPLWHDLAGQIKRRGMVIILSDCFDEIGGVLRALRHFRHGRHEVLLFHILAPEEMEFPFKKWTQFRNLEVRGDKLLVDPQRLRREYLKNFEEFCRRLREEAGGMQVNYHLMRTDEPVERALGIYLTKRQSRR